MGEGQAQLDSVAASVDGSSLFFSEIYLTFDCAGVDGLAFCDNLWTAFKENTEKIPSTQTGWGSTSLGHSGTFFGSVTMDFVLLDCGQSAGLGGEPWCD